MTDEFWYTTLSTITAQLARLDQRVTELEGEPEKTNRRWTLIVTITSVLIAAVSTAFAMYMAVNPHCTGGPKCK